MYKISVKNLSKAFNGSPILQDIHFSAKAQSITVLVGQSGTGKSTLLRCLAQLEVPDTGSIILNGEPIIPFKKPKKHFPSTQIGFIFQQFHLWPHMTVLNNLIMAPMKVLKIDKQLAIVQAEKLLADLGIKDKCHHYPKELSGGEQQRVAIARALLMQPDILLFDEPTANLDPMWTKNIAKIIQSLANKGLTSVVATHDIAFAKKIATEILFLEHGKILETLSLTDKNSTPHSTSFKEFLNTNVYDMLGETQ